MTEVGATELYRQFPRSDVAVATACPRQFRPLRGQCCRVILGDVTRLLVDQWAQDGVTRSCATRDFEVPADGFTDGMRNSVQQSLRRKLIAVCSVGIWAM